MDDSGSFQYLSIKETNLSYFRIKSEKYKQNALVQKELIELIIKRLNIQSGNFWADLGY